MLPENSTGNVLSVRLPQIIGRPVVISSGVAGPLYIIAHAAGLVLQAMICYGWEKSEMLAFLSCRNGETEESGASWNMLNQPLLALALTMKTVTTQQRHPGCNSESTLGLPSQRKMRQH